MATAFRGAATYYLSADEALARAAARQAPLAVRVRGSVQPGSLRVDAATATVRFVLGPEAAEGDGRPHPQAAPRIQVVYRGAPPDSLGEGTPVIVEGSLSPDGQLTATQLLVTCPSRYEPER